MAKKQKEESNEIIEVVEPIKEPISTEIRITDEQFEAIQTALQTESLEKSKGIFDYIKKVACKLFSSFVSLLLSIITLKNTGKWVSVITISFVLYVLYTFLNKHNYSIEAMTIAIPHIAQIAVIVFTIIGGVKGVEGIVEKLASNSDIANKVKNMVKSATSKDDDVK